MLGPKVKTIKTDGRVYTFKPGKNGSLTTPARYSPPMSSFPVRPPAKVVSGGQAITDRALGSRPKKVISPAIKRSRSLISPALVGAPRG